jgi:acetolactate synthase regulatory subunit
MFGRWRDLSPANGRHCADRTPREFPRAGGLSFRSRAQRQSGAPWFHIPLIETDMPAIHINSASQIFADPNPSRPTKAPRERAVVLHIEATHCPKVFRRVLRLVTGRAIVPVDIILENSAKTVSIDILLDRMDFAPSLLFIDQLEGLPSVKSAEFLDCRGQVLEPALPKRRRANITIV